MIILRVFIWSTHKRPGRNPAYSYLISFSGTSIILVKMILQKTLLVTQGRLVPLSFCSLTSALFCEKETAMHMRQLSNHFSKLLLINPCCFISLHLLQGLQDFSCGWYGDLS
jgi:hypothetical protein